MVARLTVAYCGTAYAGWQRQENALAVQEVVEEALGRLAGERVAVVAASRTDAGVHARGQVVHVVGETRLPLRALVHGTNHHLPPDVRILAADCARAGFHARRSALSKEYSYRMLRTAVLSPLDAPYAVRIDPSVDLEVFGRCCRSLVGEHDFSAFALSGGTHSSPRRTIFAADCEIAGDEVVFRLSGSGFLRGMVRSLAGTLIDVARGRRSERDFLKLLGGAPRSAAGPTAPARALVLERIVYDSEWNLA